MTLAHFSGGVFLIMTLKDKDDKVRESYEVITKCCFQLIMVCADCYPIIVSQ